MSAPAVKARFPDPVNIIAFMSSSVSISVTALSISWNRVLLIAFRTSGLFKVIVPIPSFLSSKRVS